MILIDSDIIIDFLRKYPPAIDWLTALGDEELALPGYVVMELVQGCTNKGDLQKLEQFIIKSKFERGMTSMLTRG